MRVVILLDRPFARRERRLLSRLQIGLADEGVRIIQAVPRVILGTEPPGLYSRTVGYDPSGFPIPVRVRARALAESLEGAIGEAEEGGIDLVHIFSPAVWRLGLEVASVLGAGAMLEVWSGSAIGSAGDALSHPVRPSLGVGDPVLLSLAARRYPRVTIHDTPWGVHGEPLERAPLAADRTIAVMMLVDGSSAAYLSAAIHGFAAACTRDPRLMGFINTERARGHLVWRMLRKLKLTDRVSLIPDAEARRETVLNLDALVIPEPSGRLRSMALDAMASGMPVLAAGDPSLSLLIDGVTARLVNRAEPGAWEEAFMALAAGDPAIEAIRGSAQNWVAANRGSSAYVASVLKAYDAELRGRAGGGGSSTLAA